ncbi:MAG: sigma-70 family RNA polymerase sigma factor, partial [Dehalococcoidales bacterium]
TSRQQSIELTEAITPDDPDENPQHQTELKADIDHLVKATRQLTKAQQEVIALRFSSDLPVAEVARLVGKSEGAVKALQHSAVVALRKIMLVAEDYD